MASLISLSAELKLIIIEQLELTSTSFIPGPSADLLNLSGVCKEFRTLVFPYLFKSVTLLNEEKSGSSVLAVLHSAHAEHVRILHYIGIMAMPESPDSREGPLVEPSPEHFPDSVEQVLSSLTKLPNLERVTVQFACAKTADEDENIYCYTYDIYQTLESDEEVLEAEKTLAFRSLMERSYRALSRNAAFTIKHLELKNVVARQCSAWNLADFHAVLQGLSSFTISLRGGDNGAGWQINKVEGYLDFIAELENYFFIHLSNVRHFGFAATEDGPPGIHGGLNNTTLPLLEQHMPLLQSLSLEYIFISENLSTFITAHSNTLESIRLEHCYSGWKDEDVSRWGDFFSSIASKNMKTLSVFDIGVSDLEQMQPDQIKGYYHDLAVRIQELRNQFPGRRMLDYKHLDDKYGMVFNSTDEAFEAFESGSDCASWEQLCESMKENVDK
jgi:hypothetical protein